MILESAQILCTVHDKLGDITPYRPTHRNHPCTLWAGQSKQNYQWLKALAKALNDEFMYRFGHDEPHKSWSVIDSLPDVGDRLPSNDLTPFALAMPDYCKVVDDFGVQDTVESYRNYYIAEKLSIAQYTLRKVPEWLEDNDRAIDLAMKRMHK
jgi:hypothetical protein